MTAGLLASGLPAGFEHFFDEVAAGLISPDEQQARYGSEVDPDSIDGPCRRCGLVYQLPGNARTA